jgi:hypothetical protein
MHDDYIHGGENRSGDGERSSGGDWRSGGSAVGRVRLLFVSE